MVKVDLITGFLGAGKTTFLRHYLDYLAKKGQKVLVIENEFGQVSVDTKLLEDEACDIEDLTGKCMCCTGMADFIGMLAASQEQGYDRVVVEPSGIYDVDEFFTAMNAERVKAVCGIGSVLTIVDAKWNPQLSESAKYLLYAQLLAAGSVILSRTQCVSAEELQQTKAALRELVSEEDSEVSWKAVLFEKNWEELTDEDILKRLRSMRRKKVPTGT